MSEVETPPPDPDVPRALLEDVLSRREFHQQVERPPDWLQDLLDRLFGSMGETPDWFGNAITISIIVVAAAFVLYLLIDGGAFRRRARRPDVDETSSAGGGSRPDAREPFRTGRDALNAGRFSEAIVFLFRGMVARLTERGVLLDDPSRTNREHLCDLQRRPGEAELLGGATPTFESVRYGGRDATVDEARKVFALAGRLFPEEAS